MGAYPGGAGMTKKEWKRAAKRMAAYLDERDIDDICEKVGKREDGKCANYDDVKNCRECIVQYFSCIAEDTNDIPYD